MGTEYWEMKEYKDKKKKKLKWMFEKGLSDDVKSPICIWPF